MKVKQIKVHKICIIILSVFVLLISLSGCSRKKVAEQCITENAKAIFSESQKKHIVVQYPIENEQINTAVATMKNLATDDIITDDTFEDNISGFGFLLEETGKYLITVSVNDEILSEHIVEINEENSYYHIRMQND